MFRNTFTETLWDLFDVYASNGNTSSTKPTTDLKFSFNAAGYDPDKLRVVTTTSPRSGWSRIILKHEDKQISYVDAIDNIYDCSKLTIEYRYGKIDVVVPLKDESKDIEREYKVK